VFQDSSAGNGAVYKAQQASSINRLEKLATNACLILEFMLKKHRKKKEHGDRISGSTQGETFLTS
jgi:hypothetical protein